MWSGSGANSINGDLNDCHLEGKKTRWRLTLWLVKKQGSFTLGGWLVSIVQTMFVFCLRLDGTVVWSCLCFDPTRSQNILVWCWCSVKCSTRSPKAQPWEPGQLLAVRDCFSPHFLEVLQVLELFKASHSCDTDWISGTWIPLEWWLLVGCEDVSLVRPKARKVLMLPRESKQLERKLCSRVFFLFYLASGQTKVWNFQSFLFFKAKVKWNWTKHLPYPKHCARDL